MIKLWVYSHMYSLDLAWTFKFKKFKFSHHINIFQINLYMQPHFQVWNNGAYSNFMVGQMAVDMTSRDAED